MDFSISPRVENYRARIAAFVDAHVLPLESDNAAYDEHENIRVDLFHKLQEKARSEGL